MFGILLSLFFFTILRLNFHTWEYLLEYCTKRSPLNIETNRKRRGGFERSPILRGEHSTRIKVPVSLTFFMLERKRVWDGHSIHVHPPGTYTFTALPSQSLSNSETLVWRLIGRLAVYWLQRAPRVGSYASISTSTSRDDIL